MTADMMQCLFLLAALAAVSPALGQNCRTQWNTAQYKSYAEVLRQVQADESGARILRIALCGEGVDAYFQAVVLSDGGKVVTHRINAAKPEKP